MQENKNTEKGAGDVRRLAVTQNSAMTDYKGEISRLLKVRFGGTSFVVIKG